MDHYILIHTISAYKYSMFYYKTDLFCSHIAFDIFYERHYQQVHIKRRLNIVLTTEMFIINLIPTISQRPAVG